MSINLSSASYPDSWYAASATPLPAQPVLQGRIEADVCILGAGYTGLSAALELAEAGYRVVVLEAERIGWGASGRNGGQVNPTMKHDPDDLLRLFGPERGERLIETVSRSADLVFDLIRRHRIECDAVRHGWLQVGYTDAAVAGMHARARQWQRRGEPVQMLARDEVAQRLGTSTFVGGWLDGRAGAVQPLAYARGLARAALAAGARIHGNTEVLTLEHQGDGAGSGQVQGQGRRWRARTSTGVTVVADRVLIATNGYTAGLWPGLRQTVIAANSFIVATRPLDSRADAILSGGETVSTSQRLLLYFRRDAQGRLLLGGRGRFADPAGPADYAHLERSLRRLYPRLGPIDYQYRWSGRIAITRDFMPHVHEPAPGLTIALGYNGRGIALATSMGRHVATRMIDGAAPFPFPVSPITPIPLHGLQRLYIAAGVAWYGLLDRLNGSRA